MKNLFKKAHEMTRRFVEKYGVDYQAQFGLCLSFLFEEMKKEEKEMIDTKKLEEMILNKCNMETQVTINEWKKYGKHRIYINVKIRRRGVTSFIDLKEDKVVTKQNGIWKDWIMELVDAVDEVVKEYKEEIIELIKIEKEEKEETKEAKEDVETKKDNEINLHTEFLGLDNNLSSEDFEDITGMKKFDESYF